MIFWRKSDKDVLNSKEYESVVKKLIEINAELEDIKVKFKILETNFDNLRGNFNRKLSGLKKEEIIEEQEDTKSINNPVILPDNEFTFKRR